MCISEIKECNFDAECKMISGCFEFWSEMLKQVKMEVGGRGEVIKFLLKLFRTRDDDDDDDDEEEEESW